MMSMISKPYSNLVIAAFTAYPWDNALPKLRLLDPADFLGIKVLPSNDFPSGDILPGNIEQADLVFIQRDYPRYYESYRQVIQIAQEFNKPILYDIDDLLFETMDFPNQEEADYYLPVIGLILEAIISANIIVTPSANLKHYLDKLHPNVHIFPNFLNDQKWLLREPPAPKSAPLTIGYIGTRSHMGDIESLAPVIERIGQIYPEQVQFRFWIEQSPSQLMRLSNVVWSPFIAPNYEDYIAWMAEIQPDIWIAPLLDSPYNRVKSPIKFLEYSACGVPGIYSRVPPYTEVIAHGANGLLASSVDEWVQMIRSLVEEPAKRREIGHAALQTIRKHWLLSRNAERWGNIIQEGITAGSTKPNLDSLRNAIDLLSTHYTNLARDYQSASRDLNRVRAQIADLDDLLYERSKRIEALTYQLERANRGLREKIEDLQWRIFPLGSKQRETVKKAIYALPMFASRKKALAEMSSLKPIRPVPKLERPIRLALYTTDDWSTASAHIRLIGPSFHPSSGIRVLDGCQASTFPHLQFFIQADAVVIQRDFPRHFKQYQAVVNWAAQTGKPVLYEIDDLLYDLPEGHPEKAYFRPVEGQILAAIRDAGAVITSTIPLAKRIRQINPNTWVLMNYLDDNLWKLDGITPSASDGEQPVRIGYMGGITQTHIPDILSIKGVLDDLLDRFGEKISLHFWGGVPSDFLERANVVFHSEKFPNYKEFAAYFSQQSIDIFIAPLIEGDFNDCKSAIKYLEYSSLSVPGVYSDVFPYREIIYPGVNGFLATNDEEWKEVLIRLVEDYVTREKVGKAALNTVKNQFLLSRHAQEWGRTYEAAILSCYG